MLNRRHNNDDSLFGTMGLPNASSLTSQKPRGLTLERIFAFGFIGWIISGVIGLIFTITLIVVAIHFLSKVW